MNTTTPIYLSKWPSQKWLTALLLVALLTLTALALGSAWVNPSTHSNSNPSAPQTAASPNMAWAQTPMPHPAPPNGARTSDAWAQTPMPHPAPYR